MTIIAAGRMNSASRASGRRSTRRPFSGYGTTLQRLCNKSLGVGCRMVNGWLQARCRSLDGCKNAICSACTKHGIFATMSTNSALPIMRLFEVRGLEEHAKVQGCLCVDIVAYSFSPKTSESGINRGTLGWWSGLEDGQM